MLCKNCGCESLVSFEMPVGAVIESISYGAFANCISLRSLTIYYAGTTQPTGTVDPAEMIYVEKSKFTYYGSSSIDPTIWGINLVDKVTDEGVVIDDNAVIAYRGKAASVTVPEGVTKIASNGFNCYNYPYPLSSITLPSTLTTIEKFGFAGCIGLTSIEIPESVTYIGDGAFVMCTALRSFTLKNPHVTVDSQVTFHSSTITHIPKSGFQVTGGVPDRDPYFYGIKLVDCITDDGLVINDNVVICSLGYVTTLNVPEGVTEIGETAFSSNPLVTQISLPSTLTKINGMAFAGCARLTSITIPENVTFLGWGAFYGCSSLSSFTLLSNKIENTFDGQEPVQAKERAYIMSTNYHYSGTNEMPLDQWGIAVCDVITDNGLAIKDNVVIAYRGTNSQVVIPEGVVGIAASAFRSNAIIEHFTLPNTLETIGEEAFSQCSKLQSINIPSSVVSIPEKAFSNCSSLTDVTFSEGLKTIGDYAFYQCKLSNLALPNTLEGIGIKAFYGNKLSTLTIPASVKNIDGGAFYISSLTTIIVKSETPPSITNSTFNRYDVVLIVPFGFEEVYKKTKPWSILSNNITYFVPDGYYEHHIVNCKGEPLEGKEYIYITQNDSEVRKINDDGHVYENCHCIYCDNILHKEYVDGFCNVCGIPGPIQPKYGEYGYIISNVHELLWYREKANTLKTRTKIDAVQTADIDLSSVCSEILGSWTPIGTRYLYGTYNGQNHKITGLYINKGADYQALFGDVGWNSSMMMNISDLTVHGNVTANQCAAIICASINGSITNCHSYGSVTAYGTNAAGVASQASYGDYYYCTNHASINQTKTSSASAGVICSITTNSSIVYGCFNEGDITTVGGFNGGVTKYATNKMYYCGNTGTISGVSSAGGIIHGVPSGTFELIGCWSSTHPVSKNNPIYLTLTDCYGPTEIGDAENLTNGKLAYLLGPDNLQDSPWGQTIGTDAHPVVHGAKVYKHQMYCVDTKLNGDEYAYYTNDDKEMRQMNGGNHTSENCRCIYCGTDTHNYVDNVCTECGSRMKCEAPTYDELNGLRCSTPGAKLNISIPTWEASSLEFPKTLTITVVATKEGFVDSEPFIFTIHRADFNNDGVFDLKDLIILENKILGK